MENEIWKVESIKSGNKDDLFEAIITAQDGTKLIAQVPFMKTAQEIVDMHNQLLPPHEWVCAWCECDFGEKHGKKCEARKIIHEGREAAQQSVQRMWLHQPQLNLSKISNSCARGVGSQPHR